MGLLTTVKPVVKTSTMDQDLQDEVILVAQHAMDTEVDEQHIAHKIKSYFEQKYHGMLWHCCVGRNVACYVTHEQSKFLYFYVGQMAVPYRLFRNCPTRDRALSMTDTATLRRGANGPAASPSPSLGAVASVAALAASRSSLVRRWSRRAVQATPPPPLPLISLPPDDDWAEFDVPTRTGFAYSLPYLALEDEEEQDASRDPAAGAAAGLHDRARICALLSEYMTQNELYQTRRHGFGIDTTLVYKRHKQAASSSGGSSPAPPDELQFDAFFESGNLDRAFRVLGRHYASRSELVAAGSTGDAPPPSASASASASASLPFPFFVKTDLEYDLYCDTDVSTHGHIQWYFFRVAVPPACFRRRDAAAGEDQGERPPASTLKVRFNLRNMLKKSSLYNEGMLPAVYIDGQRGWHHAGANVCYFRNADSYRHRKTGKPQSFYTLSFVYEFLPPAPSSSHAAVHYYFAHCYPYPYTRLQRYLLSLQQHPLRRRVLRRRVLCKTMAGNICDVLTVTDFERDDDARSGVVLTARVHPGESNSSFVMHGVLDFLTGESLEARYLRHRFVFKIVPMLNPDGVIHGNYRCSLAGTDLNRRYRDPSPTLHPSVHAVKALVLSLQRTRGVSLYCDLHGHSRKKNIFLYGCVPHASADATARSEAARLRLFPHVLSKTCSASSGGYFSFPDCTFSVSSSKRGTGRVVMWDEARVLHSFTLEASFFGVGVNDASKKHARRRAPRPNNNGTSNQSPPHQASEGSCSRDDVDLALSTHHFMPSDLRRAGVRLCLALVPFGHLIKRPPSASSESSASAPSFSAGCEAPAASTGPSTQEEEAPTTPLCFSPRVSRRPTTATTSMAGAELFPSGSGSRHDAGAASPLQTAAANRPRLAPLGAQTPRALASSTTPRARAAFSMEPPTSSAEDPFDELFLPGSELFGDMGDPEELLKEIEDSLPEDVLLLQQQQDSDEEEDESPGSESDPSGDDMEDEELHRQPSWTAMIPAPDEEIVAELPPTKPLKEPRAQMLLKRFSDSQLRQAPAPQTPAASSASAGKTDAGSAPAGPPVTGPAPSLGPLSTGIAKQRATTPLAPIRKSSFSSASALRVQWQGHPSDRNRDIAAMHLRAVKSRTRMRRQSQRVLLHDQELPP
ncbi:hypothetical protein ATCC90586_001086 [Pythium insidiosum]|nr:hypothetical protein ATCC90586_001086 [Pythium insidiosum]